MENKIALSKITKATTELMKSQKAQNTAAEALKELIQEAEEVSKKIQDLEIEKNTLAEELEIGKRENKIELGLSVKENEEEVLQNILDTRSLETINPEELEELRETADRATSELKEEIQKDNNQITIELIVEDMKFKTKAMGSSELSLKHKKDIVLRKSAFTCTRTVGINAENAAIDVPREMINKLRNPNVKGLFRIIIGETE